MQPQTTETTEELFLAACAAENVPVKAIDRIWRNFVLNPKVWQSLQIPAEASGRLRKSILKQRWKALQPNKPHIDYTFKNQQTGELIDRKEQEKIPKKEFNLQEYELIQQTAYRTLPKIVEMHCEMHELQQLPVPLDMAISNDGVAESQSSNKSYNAWSVRFLCCKDVHPFRASRAVRGSSMFDTDLDFVIDQIM